MSKYTERTKYLISVHRCIRCAKQDAYTLIGKQRCYECTEKDKERAKRNNQLHKEEHRQYAKERYAWLKSKGLCVICGKKKAKEGRVMCPRCLARNSANTKRYYKAHKEMVENG